MNEVWVNKEYTVPMGGKSHYGVAKAILEELEKLKERDHNVEFVVNTGPNGSITGVVFKWREREVV